VSVGLCQQKQRVLIAPATDEVGLDSEFASLEVMWLPFVDTCSHHPYETLRLTRRDLSTYSLSMLTFSDVRLRSARDLAWLGRVSKDTGCSPEEVQVFLVNTL